MTNNASIGPQDLSLNDEWLRGWRPAAVVIMESHREAEIAAAEARGREVGGVMVTLAALCLANGLDMQANGETELARIWTKVEEIRAKQAAKPKYSPLPMAQS